MVTQARSSRRNYCCLNGPRERGCWRHKLVFLTCLLLTLFYVHGLVIHSSAQRLPPGFEDSRVQEPRQALCWFEGLTGRCSQRLPSSSLCGLLQPLVPGRLASLLLGRRGDSPVPMDSVFRTLDSAWNSMQVQCRL